MVRFQFVDVVLENILISIVLVMYLSQVLISADVDSVTIIFVEGASEQERCTA
jgi:hypothetical protein